MIRYAITRGDYRGRPQALAGIAKRWAEEGIEFVQVREKGMPAGELVDAVRGMAKVFRTAGGRTKLLVNGRPDIAIAARADGVHLTGRAGEMTPGQVRQLFAVASAGTAVLSASCHSLTDVERAVEGGVDLILFGPVFEKRVGEALISGGRGLEMLRIACGVAKGVSVLALGGVREEDAATCVEAGAAGVAGIRLFHDDMKDRGQIL